jgi:predicted transcriptional regulator
MDKSTETLLILGAVAIGGYYLYTKIAEPVTKTVESASYIIFTPGYKQIDDAFHKVLPLKPDESVWFTPGWKLLGRLFGQNW